MSKTKKKVTKSEVTKKKISFVSAIFLVIGSSIGAGIFLKNGEVLGNVGGSTILALVSWIVSIFGVICMGVSLAEIASATTDSNLGIISWVKNFCHKYLYKVSKYFMAFLYLPLNFFLMPYYVVIQFQDAFGWQTQWYISALIAFAITAWFFIASGLSSKLGNIQNWVVTAVKFIPLAFCIIAGITLACMGLGGSHHILPVPPDPGTHSRLAQMFPMLGIIGSVPAIIFSYDGFYSAAGIQSEMEEPKKTPAALVVGLVIVSIINLLIAVALLFGSENGKVNMLGWFNKNGFHWVIGLVEILIAIGVLGIINGFAIYNPLYYQDLIKADELPLAYRFKDRIASQKHNWVGLIYAGVITLAFFILFTLIGALGYADTIGYGLTDMVPIGSSTGDPLPIQGYDVVANGPCNSLYSFCDLMANWTSIIAFLCVVFATIGAMINRKTKRVQVRKAKGFWFCSIVSTIVISVACLFIVVASIADIAIVAGWAKDIGKVIPGYEAGYTQADWNKDMLGAIMTLVMLFVFILVCWIPSQIETSREKYFPKGLPVW
ncbi:MAG: APC family permease [Mycoplasmoidaceae bacterium]